MSPQAFCDVDSFDGYENLFCGCAGAYDDS